MAIRDELIEELLAGKDPQKVFSSEEPLDELTQALAGFCRNFWVRCVWYRF